MLLTVAQAARRRKTTRFSVHRWLKSGLKHQRFGSRTILIDAADLDAFAPREVGNPTFQKKS